MAEIFPTLENIKRLKVQPTVGELFLINYLIKNLPKEIEIYFQPFLNGDMPDIILMQKNVGVSIIEVKDWNLDKYKIDANNHWILKENDSKIKSPFKQVNTYKENLFNLHISGMLEQKIKNPQFYGRIKTYVYFHKASKIVLSEFYNNTLTYYNQYEQSCHQKFKYKKISYLEYTNELDYSRKKKKYIKDNLDYDSVANDNLKKITLPSKNESILFNEAIYNEFKRYLQPPYHVLSQGKEIIYTTEQDSLIGCAEKSQKIKGVAGSGKTAVLAKKAVNSHKKHGERVLILTYNITIRSYIHDKISDIRENFGWENFYIDNYHDFFRQNANYLGIDITVSQETKEKENILTKEDLDIYLEKKYYSSIKLFETFLDETIKYKSIYIDEIQDYRPEWIKIIRKYFLAADGEMILFGDEKQNIYGRELESDQKIKTVHGFGSWKKLTKSTRQLGGGDRIVDLAKKFQQAFFKGKYEVDNYKNQINQLRTNEGIYSIANCNNLVDIANIIFKEITLNNIHPNDVAIISSRISPLRNLESILRTKFHVKTITTFETQEMYDKFQTEKYNEISNIGKIKKRAFNANSGKLKMSTIHSFKGFEAQTVFLILNKHDNPEIVYAGITRSKSNLMIFAKDDNLFTEFFNMTLLKYKIKQKDEDILNKIKNSVSTQTCIDIEYAQHNKLIKFDYVKPYKILFMNENFYLACEVSNKYKFTMFRLSNIKNIVESHIHFDINIDIQDFIANIQTPFSTYRENYREYLLDVIVEVDKSKACFFTSKQFLASQKIVKIKENGNLLMSFKVTQEMEVEELIKKWLPFVKVIEPISLDEKIKTDIKQYLY